MFRTLAFASRKIQKVGLNPLKSGLCFGRLRKHYPVMFNNVSIPSNRGYVSDQNVKGTIRHSDGVSIPSNRGYVSDATLLLNTASITPVSIPSNRGYVSDLKPGMSIEQGVMSLNPLKSGLCFGPN